MSGPIKRQGKTFDGRAWAFTTFGSVEDADYLEEIFISSDRAAVIVSFARLEELVRNVLEGFFIQNDALTNEVLDPNGSLGTFAAKVDIACLLGLLSSEVVGVLKSMAKIRNNFAHNHTFRNFDDLAGNPKAKKNLNDLIKKAKPLIQSSTSPNQEVSNSKAARSIYYAMFQPMEMELRAAIQKSIEQKRVRLGHTYSQIHIHL